MKLALLLIVGLLQQAFPTADEVINQMIVYLSTAIPGRLIGLGVLIAIDFLLGLVVSVVNKKFDLEYLPNFLTSSGLPVLGWLAAEVVFSLPVVMYPSGSGIESLVQVGSWGVFLAVTGKVGGSILSSLGKMGIATNAISKVTSLPPKG